MFDGSALALRRQEGDGVDDFVGGARRRAQQVSVAVGGAHRLVDGQARELAYLSGGAHRAQCPPEVLDGLFAHVGALSPALVGHVTAGRTNPQVAEAMFISRETVKTHMSNIFAKLGISSRSELAAAAARREASP